MIEEISFHQKVVDVQKNLKAPKKQFNKFGNYKYRNCEDILEGAKELLAANDLILKLDDEIVVVGDRVYVKATATLIGGSESLSVSAFAREPLNKKGMDDCQVTGAASSYARKYALNGLFCIDDTKDADSGLNEKRNQNQNQNNNQNQNQNRSQNRANQPDTIEAAKKRFWAIIHSMTDSFKDQEALQSIYTDLKIKGGAEVKNEQNVETVVKWNHQLVKMQKQNEAS